MASVKSLAVSAALVALVFFPQAGRAADDDLGYDVGYKAMRAHDWATAEKQLVAGLEKNPDNVFRQLNLAWVYAQTGRKTEAAMIYRKILMSDQNQTAALASREAQPVKILAERGLKLLEAN